MYPEAALIMASLFSDSIAAGLNPVDAAITAYHRVAAYQVTLKSVTREKTEIIRYYFKKPGYVRMDFVLPFKGAALVYDPVSRNVRLWPFGFRSFPGFTLSPDNSLIQSSTGQRVDRSDVGVLYQNVKSLQMHGVTHPIEEESVDGKQTLHVSVDGEHGFTVGDVAHYQLWLDRMTGFPVKVSTRDARGMTIETVEMDGLQIDPEFNPDFFRQ